MSQDKVMAYSSSGVMDIFQFRDRLIEEYRSYVTSFIRIADPKIKAFAEGCFDRGALWPESLIQLNPTFQPGKNIQELTDEGLIHPVCAQVFRRDKTAEKNSGTELRLHAHQEEAIRKAKEHRNYVLTTGTGSGKSLAYIIPIVDRILYEGLGQGIRAIIVYPMNALANSQFNELHKFLHLGFPNLQGPVRFQRYTGQEDDETRNRIIAQPPDILLTNYVMLELILTRPREQKLIAAAKNLSFLVLDELHTYRGRQGADVAMLLRRVRNLLGSKSLQCVGTSATLSSRGTWDDQRRDVAELASRLFGAPVEKDDIIGETLQRATLPLDPGIPSDLQELAEAIRIGKDRDLSTFEDLQKDPVARWVEGTFGVKPEAESDRLTRSKPIPLTGHKGSAEDLAKLTNSSVELCREIVAHTLLTGAAKIRHPQTGFPVFAFRLHQFISRGDTIYATVEAPEARYLTINGQMYSPEDRNKVLLPLCFCRECGQEYYSVYRTRDSATSVEQFLPREAHDRTFVPGKSLGFLYVNQDNPWPDLKNVEALVERLPNDWLEDRDGVRSIVKSRRPKIPEALFVKPDGTVGPGGLASAFIPTPFLFCLSCGVSHSARQKSDFSKLGTMGSEGRSTATTILTTTAVAALQREEAIDPTARKLLSFTDNRQDASLQSGHLNDFIEVGLLRGAIYQAAKEAGTEGLRDDTISQKVTNALALSFGAYAADPEIRFGREAVDKALRGVIGYRVYRDLRRGWRISSPNLEQCGLLEIDYAELDLLAAADDIWLNLHPVLGAASAEVRKTVCRTLLDYVRRELCIEVDYLNTDVQDVLKRSSRSQLREPWAFDEGEVLERARTMFPCQRSVAESERDAIFISALSGFGQYLRASSTFPGQPPIDVAASREIIGALCEGLRQANILRECCKKGDRAPVPGYRINSASLIWRAGEGKVAYRDRIRMPNAPAEGGIPNPFFTALYQTRVHRYRTIHSHEHTAQVPGPIRIEREQHFGDARLPILFCSPTMELGIDIKDLNTVNMRNVPPTPANYAQRSGRAGRSGQPAMVFTYCAFGSPHDQYFFKHPELMVSGQVHTPRVDIANEDLIRSHIYAIWLQESGLDLGNTPGELLQLSGDKPTLELLPDVKDKLHDQIPRERAKERSVKLLQGMLPALSTAGWYAEGWLDEVIRGIPQAFEAALERWRYLYRAARSQAAQANRIILDHSRPQDHDSARRLRDEAEAQLRLLTDKQSVVQSDFYSYRYFASEGFLPGYNFPRLPLSAFIPGRISVATSKEFISRPRFLAISEFGPGALIYHEGARYQVTRVMMPLQDYQGGDLPTSSLVVCSGCGYLHPMVAEPGPSNCERCGKEFDAAEIWKNMFRLQNVVTQRRERINCDEEERLRLGYELKTGMRFAERDGQPLYRSARLLSGEDCLAEIQYGDAAEIWRINLGWSRRERKEERGFWLDVEQRRWTKRSIDPDDEENGDAPARVQRVIPFVLDRRNSLLLTLANDADEGVMASLEAALKRAIQNEYQLEDSELATEPLPDKSARRHILFYEASEGGAGVLRQLVDDPDSWKRIAQSALSLCHFDPESGDDLNKAAHAEENCQAACYDCLLSYYNQPDHPILDRQLIRGLLLQIRDAEVDVSPVEIPRAAHLEQLKNLCDSGLEREFLDFLEARALRLPARAQHFYEQFKTRPDFSYIGANPAFIYVDGPPHDYPDRHQRDIEQTRDLQAQGITVLRFHHRDNWPEIVRQYPSIFGELK